MAGIGQPCPEFIVPIDPEEFKHLAHFDTTRLLERMRTMDAIKIPDSVDHAAENISGPLTKAIGNTLGDLWFLALGGISQRADLRRAKYAYELLAFKDNTERKVLAIPDGKHIEPDSQVIMSALSDAQYCVENEVLRDMFGNLIAASMNSDKIKSVHPSFSGIIRQMSSLDAKNLALFKTRKARPIAKFRYRFEDGSSKTVYDPVFVDNPEVQDVLLQASSIVCLSMFGLLTFGYDSHLNRPNVYDLFEKNPEYLLMEAYLKEPHDEVKKGIIAAEIIKGSVDITEFGERFLDACY